MKAACCLTILALILPQFAMAEEGKSPLEGKWLMTVAYHRGEEITKSPLIRNDIVFEGDKVTITYDRSGAGGSEKTATGTYSYDAKAKPPRITFKDLPPQLPAAVIARLDGDKLVICYHSQGGDVPDAFKTTQDDGRELVEFAKRTK